MSDFQRLVPLFFFTAFACGCTGAVQLNEGDVFETPGFYGMVDDEENGVYMISKDGTHGTLLYDDSAAIMLDDAWISVKHEKGKYRRHVVSRIFNGKSSRVEDSGK